MKLEFFTIPALSPQAAVDELNRFLDAHRVSHIERQFVADGAASYWSVCVTWIGGDTPVAFDAAARRGRVDYREVLGAEEFAVYDRLRTLRKRLAEADGLPPFAVFTYPRHDSMGALRRAEKRSAFRRMHAFATGKAE
ncbi:MAG: hypothetical protein JNJ60_10800 [Rhodocyclaceae bacterium]|nr:hypothetical protein [Rhodocyclaceae bacterium]